MVFCCGISSRYHPHPRYLPPCVSNPSSAPGSHWTRADWCIRERQVSAWVHRPRPWQSGAPTPAADSRAHLLAHRATLPPAPPASDRPRSSSRAPVLTSPKHTSFMALLGGCTETSPSRTSRCLHPSGRHGLRGLLALDYHSLRRVRQSRVEVGSHRPAVRPQTRRPPGGFVTLQKRRRVRPDSWVVWRASQHARAQDTSCCFRPFVNVPHPHLDPSSGFSVEVVHESVTQKCIKYPCLP